MRIHVSIQLLVLFVVTLSRCFPFRLPGDYAYSICTSINGRVIDSLTQQPLSGVSVKAYSYKYIKYADSTENARTYSCANLEIRFFSTPEEIRELQTKPPLRQEEELRIVFEKSGYKKSEFLIPVEFVYCSRHPQPAHIPEVKIPDVFLVRE